ncbi:MAG: hydrolase [Anaerolineae bacterium]|nr:MAG: hydrolase [Anaerolineae bacterium]
MRLILFDIDGTLVSSSRTGRKALGQALREVFGTDGELDTYEFAGKTDRRIVHDLLTAEGLSVSEIEARLPELDERMAAAGRELFTPDTVRPCPGVDLLLEALRRRPDVVLALLTGNIRHTAPLKLAAAGIDPTQFRAGAFGSDSLDRNELFDIAIERVRLSTGLHFPTDNVIIVGDTPADIRCARSGGGRVVAVATGPYPAEALNRHEPDFLFSDLSDTDSVLQAMLNPWAVSAVEGG